MRSPTTQTLLYAALVSVLVFSSACKRERASENKSLPASESAAAPEPTALGTSGVLPPPDPKLAATRAYESAMAEIERVLALPSLPGAPGFEKNRPMLVARAKSEPVFFVRAPKADPDESLGTRSLRGRFEKTDFPWRELRALRKRFVNRHEFARQLLLKEGYLYNENANHAFTLVSQIRPTHLFEESEFWIQRGERLMHAKKQGRHYYFVDGTEEGRRVRLLHLDRMGTGPVPEPLHRDFRSLRYKLFFERAKVRHVTEQYLVADLRYGKHWVPTLLKSSGARLERVVEALEPELLSEINEERGKLELEMRLVSRLREAMRAQIDEALPFDEPKTEVGQQDGVLRRQWRYAYLEGRDSFRFNEDKYDVFNKEGQPKVPQVCIDFMVDTFERSSGRWWKARALKERTLTPGKLDLSEYGREELRRTKHFLDFAREHGEWFDVLTFPKYMRVELGYKEQFFRWLDRKSDHFRPGDIILIRGITPWDAVDEHTHSFFIYESDPLTGIPIAIAGNAGPANLWSWETEARRTPNRTLRTRIRPKVEWLQTFIDTDPAESLEAPALISGR